MWQKLSKNDFIFALKPQRTASVVLWNILFKKREKKKHEENLYNTAHFLCTWHEYLQFKKTQGQTQYIYIYSYTKKQTHIKLQV